MRLLTVAERRQREKNQRRETVINVASKLFFSKGYEKVSIDEIANYAELSKATVYTYFKDKESLFFAVVNRGIKILRSMITEEEERMQSADNNFEVMRAAFGRFILEYPDYARAYFYFRSGRFNPSNDESMNPDAKEVLKFTKGNFEEGILNVRLGVESGVFRSDVNPIVLVALHILIYDSIATMSIDLKEMLSANGITVQKFFLEVIDLVHYAFMNNKEKNKDPEEVNRSVEKMNKSKQNEGNDIPKSNATFFYIWDKDNC